MTDRVLWAVLASLAIVLPTLIAYNVAPSATLFNQAAAFVGWGGFLMVPAASLERRAMPASSSLGGFVMRESWAGRRLRSGTQAGGTRSVSCR